MGLIRHFGHFFSRHFPADSLRERFARGMAWVVLGSSLRQGANFLAGIVVARILGIADFGKLAVIQGTILMLTGFGQAGIGLSSTKYVASTRTTEPERTGRIIGFSLAFTCVMACVAGACMSLFSSWISNKLLPRSNISTELRLSTLWLILEMINIIQLRILAGLEAFSRSAHINTWQAFFLLPVVITGAYFAGLNGAIIAFSAISLVGCLFGQLFIRRECTDFAIAISYRGAWEERTILRMSTMVWLSGMAMNLTNWFAGILLARQPTGVSEYALFNAAQRLQNIIIFIPQRIFQVTVPLLSNLYATGNRNGFRKTLLGAGGIGTLFTLLLSFPVYIFSEQLMFWYGPEFSRGYGVLRIIAFTSCVSAAWTIASAGLWAAEQSKQMFLLDILRGGLLVLLCFFGMAASSLTLALAHLFSYSIGTSLLMLAVARFSKKA